MPSADTCDRGLGSVRLEDVIVAPEALAGVRWSALFGNNRPVELEIGIGKGGFLLRRSQAHPERNFLGIEWANKYYKYAADRMRRWNVANVRVVRTDAADFVKAHCPRTSLSMLHVYHPDPWPKARHQRRRLVQPAFVEAAVACLVPGGRWALQTDHAEYFEQIRTCVLDHPALVEVPFDEPDAGLRDARLDTNFEVKYRRAGRAIYQLAVRRLADPSTGKTPESG